MESLENNNTVATATRHAKHVAPESWGALILLWLVYAMDANSRQMFFMVLPSITKEFGQSAPVMGFLATLITMRPRSLRSLQ